MIKIRHWDPAKEKPCHKCGALKPLEEFNKRSDRPDGKQLWCRSCQAEYWSSIGDDWFQRRKLDHILAVQRAQSEEGGEEEKIDLGVYEGISRRDFSVYLQGGRNAKS